MHHERQDGSGYHHGASGAQLPTLARLLAAADAYQAMTQDRPYRPALAPDAAARELEAATRAGRHDPECDHVQHLYTKIGASTRAAAAMFAMEHGLLR
jgi:HD-GYP domain-containing protein (c-di-GMP phosphodiesterase class II)